MDRSNQPRIYLIKQLILKSCKFLGKNNASLSTYLNSILNNSFTFIDIVDALMNQIQSDLNQRGLCARDFRNAIRYAQTDEELKEKFWEVLWNSVYGFSCWH